MRLDLLCQLLDRALFQQLRTAERLGYVVSASAPRRWGVCGLRCVGRGAAACSGVRPAAPASPRKPAQALSPDYKGAMKAAGMQAATWQARPGGAS